MVDRYSLGQVLTFMVENDNQLSNLSIDYSRSHGQFLDPRTDRSLLQRPKRVLCHLIMSLHKLMRQPKISRWSFAMDYCESFGLASSGS